MREVSPFNLTYTQLRLLILAFVITVLIMFTITLSNIFSSTETISMRQSYVELKSTKCQLDVKFERAEGGYMIFFLTGSLGRINYLQQSPSQAITFETVNITGRYLGSVMPNTEFYISISDSNFEQGLTHMFIIAQSTLCESTFVDIPIPASVESCVTNRIRFMTLDDYRNGCLRINYYLDGKGDVYGHYRSPSDNGRPDELAVYKEGIYFGKYYNENIEALYCGLYDNSTYEFYLVSKVNNCISKLDMYVYKMQVLSEEAKWGAGAIKNIQIQHSSHIGIHYHCIQLFFVFQIPRLPPSTEIE